MRKADYLFIRKIGEINIPPLVDPVRGKWQEVLKDFGFEADVSEHLPDVNGAALFALKDDAVKELQPRKDLAVGRRYFVNVTPSITEEEIKQLEEKRKPQDKQKEKLDTRNVKPFDALQEQAHGVKRLGILRMDVDNLGKLFPRVLRNLAWRALLRLVLHSVSTLKAGWDDLPKYAIRMMA